MPPKVIVTRVDNLLVGVLVDNVTDSIHLNPKDIMAIPSTVKGKGISEGFLEGTAPYCGGVLSLLDLRKLLMSGELMVDEQI
jgi:chemotaxis signal transduction protein